LQDFLLRVKDVSVVLNRFEVMNRTDGKPFRTVRPAGKGMSQWQRPWFRPVRLCPKALRFASWHYRRVAWLRLSASRERGHSSRPLVFGGVSPQSLGCRFAGMAFSSFPAKKLSSLRPQRLKRSGRCKPALASAPVSERDCPGSRYDLLAKTTIAFDGFSLALRP
jgi:hypothetical protein